MRAVANGVGNQRHRLDRGMHRQLFRAPRLQAVEAGIIPDIGAIAAMAAELDIIDVRRRAVFEDRNQLVLGAVEAAHAAIVLAPDTEILEFAIDFTAGAQQGKQVAPIHADKMNGAQLAVRRHMRSVQLCLLFKTNCLFRRFHYGMACSLPLSG